MANLTANDTTQRVKVPGPVLRRSVTIKDGNAVYADGIAVLVVNTGYAKQMASGNAAYERAIGIIDRGQTGDIDGSSGNGIPAAGLDDMAGTVEPVTVAGGAADITDRDKLVFATGDNLSSSPTVTRPTANASPIGYIDKWNSSTSYKLRAFEPSAKRILDYLGAGRITHCIGQVSLLDCTSGACVLSGFTLHGMGAVGRFFTTVAKKTTAASKGCTLQLYLDGSAVTGAAIALTSALNQANGTVESGAITRSAARFRDGSTLKVIVSAAASPFLSGAANLFVSQDLSM